ncbi:unnamed protein product [Prorocentrum cordatum]|uniref:Uncharacterized protein n=1 Tax=Prorocentrum cordatum TaxID=2364126 RepID=A0ABN9UFN8_9DINO|nr:unnamed protein product [Polarella glacialis]
MFGQPCRPPACAARHQSCQPAMARRSPVAVVAAAAALIAAALSSSQPGWLAPRFALRRGRRWTLSRPRRRWLLRRRAPRCCLGRPNRWTRRKRYSEGVRWFMDEEMEKPPDWHVLLLDKTFEQKKNTVAHVAACISAVVGLATVVAMRKTQHAKASADHREVQRGRPRRAGAARPGTRGAGRARGAPAAQRGWTARAARPAARPPAAPPARQESCDDVVSAVALPSPVFEASYRPCALLACRTSPDHCRHVPSNGHVSAPFDVRGTSRLASTMVPLFISLQSGELLPWLAPLWVQ